MNLRSRRGGARPKFALLLAVLSVAALSSVSPSGASLADSDFEGADGDQVVTTAGNTDWESFLPDTADDDLFIVADLPTGGTDNALAGGTKDDSDCPNVTLGTIPGNKDDLQRFYLAHETIVTNDVPETFLYLGYVRALPSGTTASAHGVFELNKGDTPCPPFPAKGKTPGGLSPFVERTIGDARISFDDEGGSSPVVSFQTWQAPCPAGGPGCWTAKVALPASKAVGAFNPVAISDRLNGDPATTLSLGPQRFSEAKVSLTAAGLLDPNDCEGFSKASLYTGASGNSDKEQSKDFIAPEPINLNSCQPAAVNVLKTFNGAAPTTDAVFDLYYDTDGSGTINTGDELLDSCTIAPADVSDTDLDGDFDGTCSFGNLEKGTDPFGDLGPHTVIVTESTVPDGFNGGADVSVTFTFGSEAQSFDVEFGNSPAPGDVDLAKVDDSDPANPVEGAVFTLYADDGGTPGTFDDANSSGPDTSTGRTCTTDSAGVCLEDGVTDPEGHAFVDLDLGDYCVAETIAPTGYDPAAPQCFTIGLGEAGQTLDLGNLVDPRQHRVIVLVCHEGTDTLFPSDVTLGAETETSLGNAGLTAAQEAALCNLGGAQFDHLSGHDDRDLTVSLGTPGH